MLLMNVLGLKLIANNFLYLGNFKKLVRNLTSIKSNKDNVRFAVFMAMMNFTYKFVLCVMRRFKISDKINAPVAGFIAGLMSYIDAPKRRQFLTCILLSRFFDTTVLMARDREIVPEFKNFPVFIWILCAIMQ